METNDTVLSRVRHLMDDNDLKAIHMPSITITRAPANGNNPNALYLKAEGDYLGKVTADNQLRTIHPVPQIVKDELRVIAIGGIQALANIGKIWGSCTFCGRTLEDPESVERGYGPVCAKRHNLPHNNRHGF